jgi:DNA-binding MarR family transcriptional regulator
LRELAEGQHCVPSNITQKMDRLEKDGLVRRIADSEDRRISRAELTALGRKRTAEAMALMEKFNADFEQTLSPTDRAALTRVVASIRQ